MSTRPVLRILALLGIALLLHYLLYLLIWQPTDADLLQAWVLQPLGSIVSYTWACYVIWAIAVFIVSIRLRDSRPAPRVLWFSAAVVVASSIGPLIVTGIVLAQSGGAVPSDLGLALFVVMVFAIPFTVAALVSIVLVELVIARSPSARVDTRAIGASPVR